MLLRFRAGNHLSIRDPQELSLAASRLSDAEIGLIACPTAPNGKVVPTAIIYGANASGKSNIVDALQFMRHQVLYSHSQGQPGQKIGRRPFALDAECEKKPSIFEIDFVIEGILYHYGFEASDDAFVAEWLLSYPNGKKTTLFTREGQDFDFGNSLKGQTKVISELTRANSLFIATAAQNNHEQLSSVSGFFQKIHTETEISVEGLHASMSLANSGVDARAVNFLKTVGTGIVDCRKKEGVWPAQMAIVMKALEESISKAFNRDISGISVSEDKRIEVEFGHKASNGNVVYFSFNQESAGTRRLLMLLRQAFVALDAGSIMVVDELDASLHTQACEALVALFSVPSKNPKGAQLIATTHDTNLLRSPLIRRDQIWFTEKDALGATHMFPLTDISTRQGDNLEKGYLQGRFGAIPFSGRAADLISDL